MRGVSERMSSRYRRILWLLLAVSAMSMPVFGAQQQDLANAEKAIEDKDYGVAFKLLEALSKKGLPEAECKLAYLYDRGFGTNVDHKQAVRLYVKAATTESEKELKALRETRTLSRKRLAESTDIEDQYRLAYCYQMGIDGPQNYEQAARLYEQLANKGMPEAMNNLGFLYQHGFGVKQDEARAFELYKEAADRGLTKALTNLGFLYYSGLGVQTNLNKARDLFEKAAQAKDPTALSNLGWMYLKGEGVKPDPFRAMEMFAQAATQGRPVARLNLGYMLEYSIGVPRDVEQSAKLYEMATEELTRSAGEDRTSENAIGFTCQRGVATGKVMAHNR